MLNELIKFFVEVKIHDHANYFVDSFWDYADVLQVNGGCLHRDMCVSEYIASRVCCVSRVDRLLKLKHYIILLCVCQCTGLGVHD